MSGKDIYDQHKAAFSRVSAYVVLKDGELVARVDFRFPADNAGRLYAYVHWLGTPMVRGYAGGCGYDKKSAACARAVEKVRIADRSADDGTMAPDRKVPHEFIEAMANDGDDCWNDRLRKAGFVVLQAI